uniref:CTP synthase N-terminal domain-containing protein n=1 Tax=Ditylenchus dipsaci TaxID=166011 RepID=A0A915CUX0_9BILA
MAFIQSFSERWWDYRESNRLMVVHVTMLLYVRASGERNWSSPGLAHVQVRREVVRANAAKVQTFALLEKSKIIDVHDVSNIYKVPLILQEQNVLQTIQNHFKLPKIHPETTLQTSPNMVQWAHLSEYCEKYQTIVKIALIGKYLRNDNKSVFTDAYASVIKALHHAGMFSARKVKIEYINSENLENL